MKKNYYLLKTHSFLIARAFTLLLILCVFQVSATNSDRNDVNVSVQDQKISGTVIDRSGASIPGVTIIVKGTTTGTVSNVAGEFSLSNVPANATIVFSFVGMKTQEIVVANQTQINVTMESDAIGLEEVVAVGYGTMKKATLSGAVSSVTSEDIVATKNQNVQNMLTGKIPGVRVVQKTSEPGEFNNQFDIRGFGSPLIIIDGVPRGDLQRMDPNEIESISVLKDASAAVYGVRAANGVVLVTTKKGEKGKPKLKYNTTMGLQFPAEIQRPIDAVERMMIFNEKSMRSTSNPELTYTDADFEAYANGARTSTDWYAAIMDDYAPQQQHNLSVNGGTESVDYYVNLGYAQQDGFWKSGDLNYERFNVRSNLNASISDRLRFSLKLNGIMDTKFRPYASTSNVFAALWRSVPNEPLYANGTAPFYNRSSSDIQNVVAITDADVSGYNESKNKIFQSSVQLSYDIPGIKGLKAEGLLSFDANIDDDTNYSKEYYEYNYDAASETYSSVKRNSPTSLQRNYGNSKSLLYQLSLSYENTFVEKHHVSALILLESSHSESDNIRAFRQFSISLPYLFAGNAVNQEGTASANGISDYARNGLVGKLDYDYLSKYIVGLNFRYDGSSKFPEDGQYGFFLSASAAWRISEESFIKDNYGFIDNLKLRGSYGKMGDDGALAYQFVSGYDYPNTSGGKFSNFPTGYMFDGIFTNALGFRAAANPAITWYTVKTLDIGLDADLWKGKLGFTVDYFKRDRDGLLADRLVSLPGTFGSTMPQENINSDRTKGVDLELRHQNRIGDFSYRVAGNVSITRTMNQYQERSPSGNSYDNWRHNYSYRNNDIWFAMGAAGRYESYEQIATSDIMTGNGTLPGDYIYEDWNQDGVISDEDKHPLATTTNPNEDFQNKRNYPLMNLGLSLSGQYKRFDISLLFQGASMSYISYGEQFATPLLWNGNALSYFTDRWHPIDSKKDPYDPSNVWTSGKNAFGGTTPNYDSEFLIQDGTYVRLKTIEIGYSLPASLLNKVGIQDCRFFLNGYNMLTFTGVEGLDPEHPTELYGYMYPLNKTVSIGANIAF